MLPFSTQVALVSGTDTSDTTVGVKTSDTHVSRTTNGFPAEYGGGRDPKIVTKIYNSIIYTDEKKIDNSPLIYSKFLRAFFKVVLGTLHSLEAPLTENLFFCTNIIALDNCC